MKPSPRRLQPVAYFPKPTPELRTGLWWKMLLHAMMLTIILDIIQTKASDGTSKAQTGNHYRIPDMGILPSPDSPHRP